MHRFSSHTTTFGLLLSFIAATTAIGGEQQAEKETAPNKPRVPVTISKETTFITEPLREDGYPDYLAYINQKLSDGVTPANNAVVGLLEVIGPDEIDKPQREEFFKRLGMAALPDDGNYFVSWHHYAEKVPADQRPPVPAGDPRDAEDYFLELDSVARSRPWTANEFPHLARWLEAENDRLDKLAAASKRSRFYAPLLTSSDPPLLVSALLPVANVCRPVAKALLVRAMHRAAEKNIAGAMDDIFAVHRFARHVADQATLIECLVGMALETMALDAQAALLANVDLTRDQLADLRKRNAALAPFPPAWKKMELGERMMYLDAVCHVAQNGAKSMQQLMGTIAEDSATTKAMDALLSMTIDWDLPLRRGNQWYDRNIAIGKIEDPNKQRAAFGELEHDLKDLAASTTEMPALIGAVLSPRKHASEKMANVLLSLLLPAFNAVYNAENRTETRQTLLRVAIALHEYRAEHGKFPAALDDLKGKQLATVPVDGFTASPFVYKPSQNGYLLYSLGQNGRDDGGRNKDQAQVPDHADETDDWSIRVPAENVK
jgi:hypothetical protein